MSRDILQLQVSGDQAHIQVEQGGAEQLNYARHSEYCAILKVALAEGGIGVEADWHILSEEDNFSSHGTVSELADSVGRGHEEHEEAECSQQRVGVGLVHLG